MIELIATAEIEEGCSRGIEINNQYLFVVKKNGRYFLYRNRCPHLGTPLEWQEHRFLDADGALIQCSNHGALFRIEDGHCLSGPCRGKQLQSVPFQLVNDTLVVDEKHLVTASF